MDFSVSAALVGLGASVLTELLKFFPVLNKSDWTKSGTALVVVFILALASNAGTWSWSYFVSLLVFALLNYKMIVQPVSTALKN